LKASDDADGDMVERVDRAQISDPKARQSCFTSEPTEVGEPSSRPDVVQSTEPLDIVACTTEAFGCSPGQAQTLLARLRITKEGLEWVCSSDLAPPRAVVLA
jgi:hypothetical protein